MYIVLCLFLVVDIIVLTVWQIIDPLYRELESFPHELPKDTDKDIQLKPQLEHCSSRYLNVWLGESCTLQFRNETSVKYEKLKVQVTLGYLKLFFQPFSEGSENPFNFFIP